MNKLGFCSALLGLGSVYGVGILGGGSLDHSTVMLFGGPLVAFFDLRIRYEYWKSSRRNNAHWLTSSYGGWFLVIPTWVLGIVWCIIGFVRTINGGE
ncbi:MAG TPA: hypothetical protein P5081_23210 [Phycisphaerae bacterium]|nr:hypothetical protein [Phycisphaerae bacterium]